MIFCPLSGHRMNGSAHLSILWPQNTCFCGKIGHRMKNTASVIILWQENESGELFFGRGGAADLAKRRRNCGPGERKEELAKWGRNCGAGGTEPAAAKKFSPIQAAGGSVEGPPRLSEENFLYGSSSGRGREEFISRPY